MTIRFRYFPYLVQQMIMRHMDFLDVFSLYAISQKSQTLAKSYFNRLECKLSYEKYDGIRIRRKTSPGDFCWTSDQLKLKPMMRKRKRVLNFCATRYSKQYQIPLETSGNMCDGVLRFARDLFPKIVFNFDFGASSPSDFRRMMNLTKILNVPVETVDIHHYKINDSFMREILTECFDVKILTAIGSSSSFQYDFQTNAPFKFDYFRLSNAAWVTKDHLVNLFLGCKKVILDLEELHYSDQELVEIIEKWLQAPKPQYLGLFGARTLPENIGKLPGAVPVREKADGTPVIIYHDGERNCITLRTDFMDRLNDDGNVDIHG
ncbi:hypothetical protein CAEBREN_02551 [Caenorhabditis brenneri]|uniref:F-box domain-containing protein n=1 Tax=Caenorhabditis brenneri TaxID=135651 RepID=G0NCS7_CAEBE|nr:hypothetical protein CAEBREN_02551 [Caenorhabditis brenneri]